MLIKFYSLTRYNEDASDKSAFATEIRVFKVVWYLYSINKMAFSC